jgi:branched-chain amino acid transport system permease protein
MMIDPLILLHGNYASPRWWEPVRQHLPEGVAAQAPDMRAWVEDGRTSIADLARSLSDWLEAQDLARAVIVGHSLGGVVATQFGLDHPSRARGLVLIDTGPPEGVALGRFVPRWQLPWAWLRRRLMRVALRRAGLSPQHPLAEALLDETLATDPAVYGAFSRAVGEWDVRDRLHELAMPTLLLWGAADPVMPLEIGQRLDGLIRHSRLVTVPDAGHSPPIEAPDEVVRHLLDFLQDDVGSDVPADDSARR